MQGWRSPTPKISDSILLLIVCVLQLFLFIDLGWDIHPQMTSDLFSSYRMTELPYVSPCTALIHLQLGHRTECPEINSVSVPVAMAGSSWLLAQSHLSLSLSSFFLSTLLFASFPLFYEKNYKRREKQVKFYCYII